MIGFNKNDKQKFSKNRAMQLIDIQKLAKGKSIKFDIKDKNCIVLK